jgi:surface antigen
MRWSTIALAIWGLAVLLPPPAHAGSAHGGNCVAYARDVTGIQLDGNAAAWWPNAAGRYERGQQPKVGAILVFKPSGGMRVGHVAVVSRIVGPREILVDQANWIRGRVVTAMSVVDASAANDWTSVKVIELHSGTHGRENPTYGFIYPRGAPANLGEAVAEADTRQADHGAAVAETDTRRADRSVGVTEADTPSAHHQAQVAATPKIVPKPAHPVQPAPHQPTNMQADFRLPLADAKLAPLSSDKRSRHLTAKLDHPKPDHPKPDRQRVAVLF